MCPPNKLSYVLETYNEIKLYQLDIRTCTAQESSLQHFDGVTFLHNEGDHRSIEMLQYEVLTTLTSACPNIELV